MHLRYLFLLALLWPSSLLGQPLCFCAECISPRIESYYMPAGSMKPTLEIDQCFRSVRYDAGDMPRAGEIIVFEHPIDGQVFVKRVIASGGQTVRIVDGRLWVDGAEVPWRAAGTYEQPAGPQGSFQSYARCPEGQPPCSVDIIEETLNGVTYQTLDIQRGSNPGDNTEVFSVPEGRLFVMGDNRDNSVDSRIAVAAGGVGFVPLDLVRGRLRLPE